MKPAFLALLCAVAFLAACKKSQPSPEFAEANERFTKLYARDLDDAYVSDEIGEIESLLKQVPSNSADHAAAAELLTRIQKGREEREQALAEEEAAAAEGTSLEDAPPFEPANETATPDESAEAPDASVDAGPSGPTQPVSGMTMREFQDRFGSCFSEVPAVEIVGKGPLPAYEVRDLPSCRDRFTGYLSSFVVFENGKVLGRAPKELPPRPAPNPDAGG